MKIVFDESRGIYLVEGKFYTIQRADVLNRGGQYLTDSQGNPRLEWPGQSIFGTLKLAEDVATRLASQHDDYPFVVMQAVSAFAAQSRLVVKRKL